MPGERGAGRHRLELVAFEPYPSEVRRAGFPGLTRLEPVKAQDIPRSEFARLEAGDILFIDSSHVLKVGSDVQVEILEILPRLKPGVVVHFHYIFLPAEYPKAWIQEHHRFWTEQYALQAFLTFNDRFEVLWGGSFMHLKHPDRLREAFLVPGHHELAGELLDPTRTVSTTMGKKDKKPEPAAPPAPFNNPFAGLAGKREELPSRPCP